MVGGLPMDLILEMTNLGEETETGTLESLSSRVVGTLLGNLLRYTVDAVSQLAELLNILLATKFGHANVVWRVSRLRKKKNNNKMCTHSDK